METAFVGLARELTVDQIMMANAGTGDPESGVIQQETQVTPWTISFMNGTLDAAARGVSNVQIEHVKWEVLQLFLEAQFANALHSTVLATYIAATNSHNNPDDPYYPMYESFIEGAQEGHSYAVDTLLKRTHYPLLPLLSALTNNG
ncbi:hypothetical protein [Atlantibacter hermannii]|uniref:hypothetical protein n=1 Tax=Atlantibacter hermannii TaxID=565 RepID=UPI0028B0B839|nr:hypothetical protein [Atlantibacter hermannii]